MFIRDRPLSSETASMACPALVLFTKRVKPIMMTIQDKMVTMVSPLMVICPPARERPVSYTHLDVYKRQLLSLVKLKTLVLCVTFTLGNLHLRAALDGDIFLFF